MNTEEALNAAGLRLLERLEVLKGISDSGKQLDRILFSRSGAVAAGRIQTWMEEAGLDVRKDALTNVHGLVSRSPAGTDAPRIHLGSHYDTVLNAGAYDGALGVLIAIAVAEIIVSAKLPLQHNLSVLAFSDEEGVRFNTTFLGSAFLSGQFESAWLGKTDPDGKSLADWLIEGGTDPEDLYSATPIIRPCDCFLETHIEQGPILEATGCGLGVFTSIAAQIRGEIELTGEAGHAGTTPARLRCDALTAAARMVLAVETLCRGDEQMRATVGRLAVHPNAPNVIPGRVRFTVDMRFPDATRLDKQRDALLAELESIAKEPGVGFSYREIHRAKEATMDPRITDALLRSCTRIQGQTPLLLSGAGHDCMKIAQVCPAGLLAVRCRGGISHHPDEFASPDDCLLALRAMLEAVIDLDQSMQ